MRALVPLVLGLALAACADTSPGRPATTDPPSADPPSADPPSADLPSADPPSADPPSGDPPSGDPPSGDPPASGRPEPGPQTHELVIPARHVSSADLTIYADFAGGQATATTELVYGLAAGYPRQLTLGSGKGYVLLPGCPTGFGPVSWTSLDGVEGTAATVSLAGNSLSIDLHDEGTVTVDLAGTLGGQQCQAADGSPLATVPLRHRVLVRVKRVASFLVEQPVHQHWPGCEESLVLPSGGPLWSPTVTPLDAAGQGFRPGNAPVPAAVILRSSGELTPHSAHSDVFTAGPGQVTVSVDTTLPVLGLSGFEVVGPAALTGAAVSFHLSRYTLKGGMATPIEEGQSYPLFHPGQSNGVEVHTESATTTHGALCANIPGSWLASGSPTPAQCEASVVIPEELTSNAVPVATLHAPGECRLAVTVPGTALRWETRFSTTAGQPSAP